MSARTAAGGSTAGVVELAASRWALVLCAFVATASCTTTRGSAPPDATQPGASATPPSTGPEATGDAPVAVASTDTGAEVGEPADATAGDATAGDAAGDATAGDATAGDATAGAQAPTASAGASSELPPLPPPIYKDVDASCGGAPGVGDAARPFTLKTPAGKDLALGRYRKRVVLLNFWGTWCKPCLKELPEFDRLYRRYRKHGLTLIAVATDDDAEKVQAFVKQRKLAAKVAIGGQALADAYGSPKFPFSFVIDGKGKITAAYRGYEPGCLGKLEQDIRAQLEELRR